LPLELFAPCRFGEEGGEGERESPRKQTDELVESSPFDHRCWAIEEGIATHQNADVVKREATSTTMH